MSVQKDGDTDAVAKLENTSNVLIMSNTAHV